MFSSEALHLGPLILPWRLIIVLLAMFGVSILAFIVSRKLNWEKSVLKIFFDSLTNSFFVGLIGARIGFVVIHWDVYAVSMMDILKIQDKGFHFIIGVIVGVLWFYFRNKKLLKKSKIIFIGIFTLLLVIGLTLQVYLKPQDNFPDLKFSALTQMNQAPEKVALKTFIGRPMVINLWASWCPPCHREMPVLHQAQQQYSQIHFIMLNQGEDATTVQQYLNRHQFDFKQILLDPYSDMSQHMNMFGLPSTLFFNAQGQLVARHMGELTPAMLQQYLKKISTPS